MIVERHEDAAIRATIDMFTEKMRQAEANKDCSTGTLAVGTVVTREKCDACEHKDECKIHDILFKEKEEPEAPEGGEEEAPEGDRDTVGTASEAEKIAEEEPKAE